MQVSREAEGRSKCVPRLHGPCRAPASGLAGQDSGGLRAGHVSCEVERDSPGYQHHRDRKSTRLNSSHSQISYAVFCLKKKKTQRQTRSDVTTARRSPRNLTVHYPSSPHLMCAPCSVRRLSTISV